MEWNIKKPKAGNPVRVKVDFYYHYGIFEDEEHVYAFGLPDNTGTENDDIAVVCTDIATFAAGGMVETGKMNFHEGINCKSAKNILDYAKNHVGETGYKAIGNNCEDFMNRALFGEKLAEKWKAEGKLKTSGMKETSAEEKRPE